MIAVLMLAAAAGALLGALFFGGLWVALNRLPASRRPARWLLATLLLRFALVLAGFYLVAQNAGWQGLLAAAAGFTAVRLIAVVALRPRGAGKRAAS